MEFDERRDVEWGYRFPPSSRALAEWKSIRQKGGDQLKRLEEWADRKQVTLPWQRVPQTEVAQ